MCPVLWGVPYIHFLLTQAKAYDARSLGSSARQANEPLCAPMFSAKGVFYSRGVCRHLCVVLVEPLARGLTHHRCQ